MMFLSTLAPFALSAGFFSRWTQQWCVCSSSRRLNHTCSLDPGSLSRAAVSVTSVCSVQMCQHLRVYCSFSTQTLQRRVVAIHMTNTMRGSGDEPCIILQVRLTETGTALMLLWGVV